MRPRLGRHLRTTGDRLTVINPTRESAREELNELMGCNTPECGQQYSRPGL